MFRKLENDYRIIYESVSLLHGFNFPMQLAHDKEVTDDPKSAVCASLRVNKGDIVILGSDGLSDNLFTNEIADEVNEFTRGKKLNKLAEKLVDSTTRVSPSQ